MKLLKEIKNKKKTLKVYADKESHYYIDKGSNIVIADQDYFLHQFSLIPRSMDIVLTAITKGQRNEIIENLNIWAEKEYNPIVSGGIFTMLKNKGY